MTRPIRDKAEIPVELPEKLYIGTFDADGMLLDRPGDADARKLVHLHILTSCWPDILKELARSVPDMPAAVAHRDALREAALMLYRALAALDSEDATKMSRGRRRSGPSLDGVTAGA
jgi:hypothetical protein